MSTGWAQLTAIEGAATAGSGALNAAFFLERAVRARGPRRTASALLTALSLAAGASALNAGFEAEPGVIDAVVGAPLLLTQLGVSAVLLAGGRR